MHRVVEESGVGADHEVRIDAERVVVAVDQLRTEQILAGLLRSSADRTPAQEADHRAAAEPPRRRRLLSVEDPEPSSDASLSPVVQRFAEVQGGWAKVESLEDGGSAFRVFLPDGAKASADERPRRADDPRRGIIADPRSWPRRRRRSCTSWWATSDGRPGGWSQSPEQLLVQELHRLSEIAAED